MSDETIQEVSQTPIVVSMRSIKSGVKTTEFWAMILGVASIIIPALLGRVETLLYGPIAITVIVGLYMFCRAWMKREAAKQVDLIPDEYEDEVNQVLDVVGGSLDKVSPGATALQDPQKT